MKNDNHTTKEMKRKFNSKLCELISNKACNSGYLMRSMCS